MRERMLSLSVAVYVVCASMGGWVIACALADRWAVGQWGEGAAKVWLERM